MVLNEGLTDISSDVVEETYDMDFGVFEESGLENVTLPSTLKVLGKYAFKCCACLREVRLPEELETIRSGCFCGSGLVSVRIPKSVTTIEEYAFF